MAEEREEGRDGEKDIDCYKREMRGYKENTRRIQEEYKIKAKEKRRGEEGRHAYIMLARRNYDYPMRM